MIKEDIRQLIADSGVEMLEKGITVGTWGNLSARDPETGLIYMSPSGMEYPNIRSRHVVVMNEALEIVDGEAEPTIEKQMHVEVYKARVDVNAVIHTHSTYSSVFGVASAPLPGVSEDFVQIIGDRVELAEPYRLPGTPELGKSAVKGLEERNAVILPMHGSLSVGKDMKTAMKVSMVLEKNAQIYLFARLLGGEIRSFTEDEIAAMQNFVRTKYGKANEKFNRS